MPEQVNAIDEDYLEILYNFANTYTEESIRDWYRKLDSEEEKEPSINDLLDLGYSWKDILEMSYSGG